VAANWKMHKTVAEATAYMNNLGAQLGSASGPAQLVVCPPFTALAAVAARSGEVPVGVFAQNMHEEPQGPFTGEVSAPMLVDVGAQGVVLGHSERRQYFGETDRALAAKVPAALGAGLVPLLCVGETESERDGGETERKLRHQVNEALERVPPERLGQVVIAYEPIWAIGTGVVAAPDQAQDAMAFIRALVGDRSREAGEEVRILYGGSVTPENAAELLALPDVDGALVGGASLQVESFLAIAHAARP
jgi:triosephosphate isomerase